MDARAQLITDFQDTFGSAHGKRVLEDLKEHCNYDKEVDCDDGMVLSQITGMRNVFVYIKKIMESDPNEKPQTQAEGEENAEN